MGAFRQEKMILVAGASAAGRVGVKGLRGSLRNQFFVPRDNRNKAIRFLQPRWELKFVDE